MQSSTLPAFSRTPARPVRPAGKEVRRHASAPRNIVVLAAIIPVFTCIFTPAPVPWGTRALSATLWVLCLFPAFIYFTQDPRTRRPIPFLPAVSIVFGLYYMLPLVLGVTDQYYNAPVQPEVDYDYPVQLAFLGWSMMVGAYILSGAIIGSKARPRQVAWNPRLLSRWGFMLMLGGMAVAGLRTFFLSAPMAGGMFQFVLAVQWLGTGILVILLRRGELTRLQMGWFAAGFVVAAAMMLGHGNVSPMALLFAVVAFAMWIGRPHIRPRWVVGATIAIVIAVSFRGIAIDFRQTMAGAQTQTSQSENLQLMVTLLGNRIEQQGIGGAVAHGLSMTAGRSALLDLFANVVRRTPSEIPHWNGQTYVSLVGSTIPRVLWPDKPTKELGQAFGHRYRLIHSSNRSTAINLPVLVEFYANFGGIGVVFGMMIVGLIYRVLDTVVNRPGQTPLLSMFGVVILLPLIVIESDFSLVFGGLPLTCFALYLIWRQFRRSLG